MFTTAVPFRRLLALALMLTVVVAASPLSAAVYKWVDEKGKLHFSQTPPPETAGSSEKVILRGGNDTIDLDIPPDVLEDYCSRLEKAAVRIAAKMRDGYPATRALSASHGTEMRLLGKQIIGFVYGFKNTRTGKHEIGQLVYNQCLNGSYNANLKRFITKWHPELVEGQERGGAEAREPGTMMGTAWPVGGGYVLTNNHVIEQGRTFKVRSINGKEMDVRLVKRDAGNDLALLKVENGGTLPPRLRLSTAASSIGAEVFTIGFPHLDVMGYSPKLTTGVISAQTGLRDDRRYYQISVPVQAGNSGGPLLNMQGEVVGMVTSKLNAGAVFRRTGDLPQNVNYALKAGVISDFVRSSRDIPRLAPGKSGGRRQLEQLADRVQRSVMIIFAYR
jgi:S1-C subfamily serine protease